MFQINKIKLNIDLIKNIILTLMFMFLLNKTLCLYIMNVTLDSYIKTLNFRIALFMLLFSLFLIFSSIIYIVRLNKYILYLIVLLSLSADYFMRIYGVMLDETIFQSLFESSTTEALQYYHISYFIEVGLCFSFFVYINNYFKYSEFNFFKSLKVLFKGFGISFLIIFLFGVFFYKDYASFFRNNRSIRHFVNPINMFYQSYNYINFIYADKTISFVKISDDAKMTTSKKPKLFVFILGETARSSNFTLNGYPRNTNPNLKNEKNLVNFKNVTSCGTATAISVPCMFSDKTRKSFNRNKDMKRENFIDILKKVGFESTWVENNTGCKGVCSRIKEFDLTNLKSSKLCNTGGCYDEILNLAFQDIVNPTNSHILNSSTRNKAKLNNQAIYLHMLGSHGPTYFLRYPENFGAFKPVCNSSKLSDCTYDSIINTYDNTILYTDQVITNVIQKLKTMTDYDSVLVYISDHGESLGEKGIYLHSLPYILAPKEQKTVPFFFWFSDGFFKSENKTLKELKSRSHCNLSHDNLFHSILGVFKIQSKYHNESLDLFNDNFKCF